MLRALEVVFLPPTHTCPFGVPETQCRHPTVSSTVGAEAELVTQPQPTGPRGPTGLLAGKALVPHREALGEDLPPCLWRLSWGVEPRVTVSTLQQLGAGN